MEDGNNNAKIFIYSQSDGENLGRLIVTNSYTDAAGIGSFWNAQCGNIEIHGGYLHITGGENAAGIGSGDGNISKEGVTTIFGGTVTALGGSFGAGIGSGRRYHYDRPNDGEVYIFGGSVTATGGAYGAGIGGGLYCQGGKVTISGSTSIVSAKGGTDAAGIGGGKNGHGVTVTISGGTVRAEGNSYGAGIGGGECTTPKSLDIGSADVTITGGTVIAIAGDDCKGREANGGSAIGCGEGMPDKGGDRRAGSLEIPDNYRVTAGDAEDNIERVFTVSERTDACRWRNYVRIEECKHTTPTEGSDRTEALDYEFNDEKHILHCRYCRETVTDDHDYRSGNTTCVCGRPAEPSDRNVVIQFWFMDGEYTKVNGSYNVSAGGQVPNGSKIVLPNIAPIEGLQFMGYLVNPEGGIPKTIEMQAGEENNLLKGGQVVTINADDGWDGVVGEKTINFFARFLYVFEPEWTVSNDGTTASVTLSNPKFDDVTLSSTDNDPKVTITQTELKEDNLTIGTRYTASAAYSVSSYVYPFTAHKDVFTAVSIELSDKSANDETLENHEDDYANVILSERTLYKDGSWNTLCLPFDMDTFDGTPLEGATMKALSSSDYDSTTGTLTLNFADVDYIEAGKPYLVKWNGTDVVSPEFQGVTITAVQGSAVVTTYVDFVGSFSPVTLTANDKTVLFMGADNKVYYPNASMTVGSCRAVFRLHNGLTAGDIASGANARRFVLNFGDDETTSVNDELRIMSDASAGEWHDLQGRRLSGKPNTKGLYINNRRKVVIK